jgi:hypothetical protein
MKPRRSKSGGAPLIRFGTVPELVWSANQRESRLTHEVKRIMRRKRLLHVFGYALNSATMFVALPACVQNKPRVAYIPVNNFGWANFGM